MVVQVFELGLPVINQSRRYTKISQKVRIVCSVLFGEIDRRRRRRQRERQKSNRFWQITTLHVQHALLYISFPSLHDYDVAVKVPNFTVSRGSDRKTTSFFFFS